MKTISFVVKNRKPRNPIAQEMFDRDGPYKPRSVAKAKAFQRRPKHQGRGWE